VVVGCKFQFLPSQGSILIVSRGLVFYVGSIPLLSLFFNALHLLALHFDVVPPQLPANVSPKLSRSKKPITIEPGLFLLALFITVIQTIMWLGQASLCTACELAPILAGTQGNVPKWCPQSNFRDPGNADLPNMLAQLATVKDIVNWVMVPLSIILVECTRRQWQRARVAAVQAANFDPGLREYDWKSGITIAAAPKQDDIELGPVPLPVARSKELPNKPPLDRDTVEIGGPPSRSNTGGLQGMAVRTGLDVGMSYESKTAQPSQAYESRVQQPPQQSSYESRVQQPQQQSSYESMIQPPQQSSYESRIQQPPPPSYESRIQQPQPTAYESRLQPPPQANSQLQRSNSRPTPPPLAGAGYETRIQPPSNPPMLQPQTYQSQNRYPYQNPYQQPRGGMGRGPSQKKGVQFDTGTRGMSNGGGVGYESRF
jgi:hypothetical protein